MTSFAILLKTIIYISKMFVNNTAPITKLNTTFKPDVVDEFDALMNAIDEEDKEQQRQQEIERKKSEVPSILLSNPTTENTYLIFRIKYGQKIANYDALSIDPLNRRISSESLSLILRNYTLSSFNDLPFNLQCNNKKRFAIIGILSYKNTKVSKYNDAYLSIRIDNFKSSISCVIFDRTIIQNSFKFQVGAVLVILQPRIPNKYKSNTDNSLLRIDDETQLLVVGRSNEFGFCEKVIYKDKCSYKCNNIINKTKDKICRY